MALAPGVKTYTVMADTPGSASMQLDQAPVVVGQDGQLPAPVSWEFLNPPASGLQGGLPIIDSDNLFRSMTTNRVIARARLDRDRRPIHTFVDTGAVTHNEHVGERLMDIHGDVNIGYQGVECRSREVMAYANEVLRYDRPVDLFILRLNAMALRMPVGNCETVEVAANNFCRVMRAWPEARCLGREVAKHLAVPFTMAADHDDYIQSVIKLMSEEEDHVREDFPIDSILEKPFRLPSMSVNIRRYEGHFYIWGRDRVPAPWAVAVSKARPWHGAMRWFPRCPSWMVAYGFTIEVPTSVAYGADVLMDEHHVLWTLVYTEWLANLAAGWVYALYSGNVYHWVPTEVVDRWRQIDPSRIGCAEDGTDLYELYRKMVAALNVFPWEHIVDDVVRRDSKHYAARAVRVHMVQGTDHGFALRHPCGDRFDWRPASLSDVGPGGIRPPGRPSAGEDEDRRQSAGVEATSFWGSAPRASAGSSQGGGTSTRPATAVAPVWVSTSARNAAVALFGATRVASVSGTRPTGALGEATRGAWFSMNEALASVLHSTEGLPLEQAYSRLALAVADATDSRRCFNTFNTRLGQVVPTVVETAPVPVANLQAILGRRSEREEADEEEGDDREAHLRARSTDGSEGQ